MRIIFLDFDGVVVCLPTEYVSTPSGKKVHALNRAAVANLNQIVQDTGAQVVVSSVWRLHQSLEYLQGYLDRAGFVGKVIDATPDLHETHCIEPERGDEVKFWLLRHPEVTSYVCLDDDGDRGPIPKMRWVLVKDGWFNGGLQPEQASQATAVLRKDAPRNWWKGEE